MKQKALHTLLIFAALLCVIGLTTLIVQAQRNDYGFDFQDYWKEYREVGYLPGTRLPCNGSSEATCTWAWRPWYQHGTDLPQMMAEQYTGRTVSGYALMFKAYTYHNMNLHGGIFRQEPATPCRTYRFTMHARSGLDEQHPTPPDARMRVGISPTGDYPDEIVLTEARINAITWSAPSNSQYAYENLSIETQAEGDTITVFTRAQPDPQNHIFIFWDEGSFSEVPHTGDLVDPNDPLPGATGNIHTINATTGATAATITWHTGVNSTLGQVLYRPIPQEGTLPPETYTHTVYLPLIQGGARGNWRTSNVTGWQTNHQVQLTGLTPGTTYEYVVVSYGYVEGACRPLLSNTTTPLRFTTP